MLISDNIIDGTGIEMSHENGVLGLISSPGEDGVMSEKTNGADVSSTKMVGPGGNSEFVAQLEESVAFNSSTEKVGDGPIIHEQSNGLTISKV